MSPEQIATELDKLSKVEVIGAWYDDIVAAAALIRAQAEALREARAKALEEAAVIAETWFGHHRPKQPKKSRFDIYDIEHWAKSATRLVAEDIRARAALKETSTCPASSI